MKVILTLPMNKALDVGYSQPGTGVGADALRAESMDRKVKKNVVGYVNPARGEQHCSECANYRTPRTCKRVLGDIAPGAWCKLWTLKGT